MHGLKCACTVPTHLGPDLVREGGCPVDSCEPVLEDMLASIVGAPCHQEGRSNRGLENTNDPENTQQQPP